VRNKEIGALRWLLSLKLVAVVVLFLAPAVVSAVAFSVYFSINSTVSLDQVFTGLAFMNIVRLPMSSLPNAVANIADFFVAARRVDRSAADAPAPSPTRLPGA
jgi:ABC-type multidrug transport system fused ATPase/permease subunit